MKAAVLSGVDELRLEEVPKPNALADVKRRKRMKRATLSRREFITSAGMILAASRIVPAPASGEPERLSPSSRSGKGGSDMFEHLIIRGDESSWAQDESGFPFVDLVAQAGATGLHAWGKLPKTVKDDFISYCRQRNLTFHLGIGVGSYGVCDGENPTDPAVLQKIKDHIALTLESQELDGLEFQTGEYDSAEYSGPSLEGKSHGRKLVDSLNPVVEFALAQKDSLWIRTELHMGHFTDDDVLEVSKSLHPRCTVEWSRFTGPFEGEGAFERGRELLAVDKRFSWFLKTLFYLTNFWHQVIVGREEASRFIPKERAALQRLKEIPVPPMAPEGMRAWADHWRQWVKMLHEKKRKTLTICHVPARMPMPDSLSRLLLAAVALARKPDMSNDQVLSILGLPESDGG